MLRVVGKLVIINMLSEYGRVKMTAYNYVIC